MVFVQDVLGLADTQASSRYWLIIGFDNKTREYSEPPEANICQDDLERLVDYGHAHALVY
jgi:hypothetical protein